MQIRESSTPRLAQEVPAIACSTDREQRGLGRHSQRIDLVGRSAPVGVLAMQRRAGQLGETESTELITTPVPEREQEQRNGVAQYAGFSLHAGFA